MECCKGSVKEIIVNKENFDYQVVDEILNKYGNVPGSLISILQKVQDAFNYLPMDVLNYIAQKTGEKPAKIHGVATFYTQFRLNPVGKNIIMLCQGTACHVNGSKAIEEAISEELSIKDGETTEDGIFTLNNVACLGCCSLSPVMMINGETYGKLTSDSVKKIIREIREKETSEKEE